MSFADVSTSNWDVINGRMQDRVLYESLYYLAFKLSCSQKVGNSAMAMLLTLICSKGRAHSPAGEKVVLEIWCDCVWVTKVYNKSRKKYHFHFPKTHLESSGLSFSYSHSDCSTDHICRHLKMNKKPSDWSVVIVESVMFVTVSCVIMWEKQRKLWPRMQNCTRMKLYE